MSRHTRLHRRSVWLERPVVVMLLVIAAVVWLSTQCGTLPLHRATVQAQTHQNDWSEPVALSDRAGVCSSPAIVHGRDGTLHVFWMARAASDAGSDAIMYVRGEGSQWSVPLDTLLAPSAAEIGGYSVAVDDADRLHLLLLDGRNGLGYHTSTDLGSVGRPQSWSALAGVLLERVLSASIHYADGTLYIVFMPYREPYELYVIRSDDGGASWTTPVQVTNAQGSDEIPQGASLAVAPDGVLHLVWSRSLLPDGYPPQRVLYARSLDRGATWSGPQEVQEGQYGLPALIAAPDNRLYLTYNGAVAIGGRYFHRSTDGGRTWGQQQVIAPGVGGLTGGSMALDSAGTLHYASASQLGGINGIAYAQWHGDQWSSLVDAAQTGASSQDERQSYEPRLIVSQGNQIHLVYLGREHAEVLYVTARSEAPRVTPEPPIATITVSPTVGPTPSPSPTPEKVAVPAFATSGAGSPQGVSAVSTPATAVLLGTLPAAVIVALVLVARFGRSRR